MKITQGLRTITSVTSANDLNEIYKAKNEVLQLDANLISAFRSGDNARAARIITRRDQIKNEIKRKYAILL